MTDPLDAMKGVTQQTDNANPDPEKEREKKEADAEAMDWASIPFTLGKFLTMIEPALAPVYAPDKCLAWGKAAHLTAKKHGWSSPSKLPELALALSSLTFAVPSVILIRQRVKVLKEAQDGSAWSKVAIWWGERKRQRAEAKAAKAAADKPNEAEQ